MVYLATTHNEHLCDWPIIIISLMTWERLSLSAPDRQTQTPHPSTDMRDRPQLISLSSEEKGSG